MSTTTLRQAQGPEGQAQGAVGGSTAPHPRLSINQATIKYATLPEAVAAVAAAGVTSFGAWREPG
jgi:hypothetical protein